MHNLIEARKSNSTSNKQTLMSQMLISAMMKVRLILLLLPVLPFQIRISDSSTLRNSSLPLTALVLFLTLNQQT